MRVSTSQPFVSIIRYLCEQVPGANGFIDPLYKAATIPHRRIIAYWTKASLFKNPISRFILSSAGSIPVERSRRPQAPPPPPSASSLSDDPKHALDRRQDRPRGEAELRALFTATYEDLLRGGALGVFPEGTSYTMPRIVQVKEGAARAALGYLKWCGVGPGAAAGGIQVVPVGIVYTDKSKYRSRVYVE